MPTTVDNAKECKVPTSHSQTHHVVHVTGESSALSEDYTDRLFVALINRLLTEFLQCNRLSSCNQDKPSLHSHLSLGRWPDVLDFWPADSSQEGVRCEGQGRTECCRAGQVWSFQPVITHHHYLLVLQRLNGSARAAIKHLSFTAGHFFFFFRSHENE